VDGLVVGGLVGLILLRWLHLCPYAVWYWETYCPWCQGTFGGYVLLGILIESMVGILLVILQRILLGIMLGILLGILLGIMV
jgi:hypothetical protein